MTVIGEREFEFEDWGEHKLGDRGNLSFEDVPLVEFMSLVFARMPGERCHRQLRSLLLYLCYVF